MRMASRLAVVTTLAMTFPLLAGCAARGGRIALVVDNDVFNVTRVSDRDDTQSATLAMTLTEEETPEGLREAVRALPVFAEGAQAHGGLTLAQTMFTPRNINSRRFIRDDRPYAGWAHAALVAQGLSLDGDSERRRDRLDHLAVDIGVVGPAAGAHNAQSQAHTIIKEDAPKGWDHQLGNEPSLLLSWEQRRRLAYGQVSSNLEWDAIGRMGVDLGTIAVRGTAGATARLGWNLPRDFGPMAVDAASVAGGGSFTGGRPSWRGHLFAGLGGRAVAHDLFLDGGVFEDGHSVDSLPLVAEAQYGFEVAYGSFSFTFTQSFRSAQFQQRRRSHAVGQVVLAWVFAL